MADMAQTRDLLAMSAVTSRLIDSNQKIIQQANGQLAGKLLTFIGTPASASLKAQCVSVCLSLRKSGETVHPVYDQALRRAASWGRLFELKVLIRAMTQAELNKQDSTGNRFTALHWLFMRSTLIAHAN